MGGTLALQYGSVSLEDVQILGSRSNGDGGALWLGMASFLWSGGRVEESIAGGAGGAAYLWDVDAQLDGLVANDNEAAELGGAILALPFDYSGPTLRVVGSHFSGNRAWQGGAIATRSTDLEVLDTSLVDNLALDDGGAILAIAAATIADIYAAGNHAGGHGGALFLNGDRLQLRSAVLTANVASGDGGGAVVAGYYQAVVEGVRASLNHAGGFGGGLVIAASPFEVEALSLLENEAGRSGGGVALTGRGEIALLGACRR